MAFSVLRILLGLTLGLAAIASSAQGAVAQAPQAAPPQALAPQALSLGLIAGEISSSETVLASEMAELFSGGSPLRMLPMLGDSGERNLALLLTEPHIDAAFVSTDALAEAGAREFGGSLAAKVELVARLGPQEIHVVARQDIGSLADLAGKEVNFGPEGGSSAVTAERLFKALDIKVEPLGLEARTAMERLKRGAIAALVVVGGKPAPLISDIPAGLGIHLLPVEFGAGVTDAYLPTSFDHDDYPNLIEREVSVPTLATGMLLLAARGKDEPGYDPRVALFVETLFSHFGALLSPDRHPKWREINLAASLPGYARNATAIAWLAKRPGGAVTPVAAGPVRTHVEAGAGGPASAAMSQDQREALFKEFSQWQRAKGH
jgi:TRAP transporter TAXI family solute receptor